MDDVAFQRLALRRLLRFLKQITVTDCDFDLSGHHFNKGYLAGGPLANVVRLTD